MNAPCWLYSKPVNILCPAGLHTAPTRFMRIFQKYLFAGRFRIQRDSMQLTNYPQGLLITYYVYRSFPYTFRGFFTLARAVQKYNRLHFFSLSFFLSLSLYLFFIFLLLFIFLSPSRSRSLSLSLSLGHKNTNLPQLGTDGKKNIDWIDTDNRLTAKNIVQIDGHHKKKKS